FQSAAASTLPARARRVKRVRKSFPRVSIWREYGSRVAERQRKSRHAVKSRPENRSGFRPGCVIVWYASKIKETTDGRRSGARGETRQEKQVLPKRSFEEHGQIDEHEGTQENGRDEAQELAEEKTLTRIRLGCRRMRAAFAPSRTDSRMKSVGK